jgi:hypothetical protein
MSAAWSMGTSGATGAGLAKATPAWLSILECCVTDTTHMSGSPCSLYTWASIWARSPPHQKESASIWGGIDKGITQQGHMRGRPK